MGFFIPWLHSAGWMSDFPVLYIFLCTSNSIKDVETCVIEKILIFIRYGCLYKNNVTTGENNSTISFLLNISYISYVYYICWILFIHSKTSSCKNTCRRVNSYLRISKKILAKTIISL